MKTNFKRVFKLLSIVAIVGAMALTSCNDDEVTPNPEDVGQNINEAYYISGVVSSSSGKLSGVKVSVGAEYVMTDSDGSYLFEMGRPVAALVTFSKDGYIPVTAMAIFNDDVEVGAMVTLSQELTPMATAQMAEAGEASELSFSTVVNSDVVVSVPSIALSEDRYITATYYTPSATPSVAEALATLAVDGGSEVISSSLIAVDLQPSGTNFDTPVTVSLPGGYIDGAYHAKLVDGEWVNQGVAIYNQASGVYEISLDGFSRHSIALNSQVSVSTTSIDIYKYTLDNRGNASAVSKGLSYNQNIGWEFADGSSTLLSTYIAGIMGTSEGLSTIAIDLDLAAAGDQMVSVTITQQKRTISYTVGSTTAIVTSYGDVGVDIEAVWGTMRPEHN